MKRLLCIISCMNTGGAETFLMKMFRNIDRKQYMMDFCVVSKENYYEEEIKQLGGKMFYIPLKSKHPVKSFNAIRRIVKEIWSLRIGTENANKILEKIEEGSGNMMAVMEMLLAENEKYINIGRQEGRQEGRLEGRLEGGKQKIKEIGQKMLAENFTKETIMKITGLKKEEIEEIK